MFELTREPAARPRGAKFATTTTKQRKLFSTAGLPGQMELFHQPGTPDDLVLQPPPHEEEEALMDFETALQAFIDGCQKIIDAAQLHFRRRLVIRNPNAKYIAIDAQEQRDGEFRSTGVYCFICREDGSTRTLGGFSKGDVLKPASYKVPARGPRGNIFDEQGGLGRMSWTGPGYNK